MEGALINPAAAGVQSLIDYGLNSVLANSANKKSKRAAISSFWMQNYFMDKQNEYNKPINQMARLREAGLNPNLVYGNADAVISSASPSGGVEADVTPSSGHFDVLGKLAMLQQMKQQEANIKETEARTEAIDDNIQLKSDELEVRRLESLARIAYLNGQLGSLGIRNAKTQAELDYLRDKPAVTFSQDPVGYFGNLALRVGDGYNRFYDYVKQNVAPTVVNHFRKVNRKHSKGGKK